MEVVFIELPAADDLSPPQYLLVQAHDVRTVRGRRNARGPQVSFTFNSIDVGGLDREFVEQSVCNDPRKAWRALQDYQAGADFDGINVDQPELQSPQPQPPAGDLPLPEVLTPRTAAAQRL